MFQIIIKNQNCNQLNLERDLLLDPFYSSCILMILVYVLMNVMPACMLTKLMYMLLEKSTED